jgi:hypothetical protein
MAPDAFLALLDEYGSPFDITAGLVRDSDETLMDLYREVKVLARFDLTDEARDEVLTIVHKIIDVRSRIAALPELLRA